MEVLGFIDFHVFLVYNSIMFNRTRKILFVLIGQIIYEVRTYGKSKKRPCRHRGNLCEGGMHRQFCKDTSGAFSQLHFHPEW